MKKFHCLDIVWGEVVKEQFRKRLNSGTLDGLAPGDCSLDQSRTRDYCHRTPGFQKFGVMLLPGQFLVDNQLHIILRRIYRTISCVEFTR